MVIFSSHAFFGMFDLVIHYNPLKAETPPPSCSLYCIALLVSSFFHFPPRRHIAFQTDANYIRIPGLRLVFRELPALCHCLILHMILDLSASLRILLRQYLFFIFKCPPHDLTPSVRFFLHPHSLIKIRAGPPSAPLLFLPPPSSLPGP